MIYDITVLSFWLLLALALGLIVGWVAWEAEERSWSVPALCLAIVIFLLGGLLAWRQVYDGRVAFYLETLLLLTGVYGIGLLLGDVVRTAFPPLARRRAVTAKTGG